MDVMNQTPNPLNNGRLTRAAIAGVGLAALGIVLFVALWVLLGNAGMAQFPRLMVSLCVPPAIIALIIGVYFLLFQVRNGR